MTDDAAKMNGIFHVVWLIEVSNLVTLGRILKRPLNLTALLQLL